MSRPIACAELSSADVQNTREYLDPGFPDGQLAGQYLEQFIRSYTLTHTRPQFVLRAEIDNLARVLYFDTFALSNPQAVILHPAFEEIRSFGPAALPFIFERIDREPFVWLTALPVIIGSSPVQPPSRGKVANMLADWKHWARANHLLNYD
jgi:hypothetical protein